MCEFLWAGVPMVLLPLMLEQRITTERLEELHAGQYAASDRLDAAATALENVIEDAAFRESARNAAQQFPKVDEETALARLADDLLAMLACGE